MDNEDNQNIYPEPNYGVPPTPSMEQTKYLSESKTFEKDEKDEIIDGDLPSHIKNRFWAFISKDSVLTWVRNEKDVQIIMDKLDTAIITYYMRLQPGEFTFEDLQHLENLRTLVFMKVLRAYEGFERRQQVSQINQTIYGQLDSQNTRQPTGLRKLVGGMFGGGH